MNVSDLWNRYAAIWSSDAETRQSELAACLADSATYCDPNVALEGRAALSDYMGGFQESLPGGHFRIVAALDHHGRSLARWQMCGPDGAVLQEGASFADHAPDGRLANINGFFPLGSA